MRKLKQSSSILTFGEMLLLDFLKTNKGNEYTAEEIESETGIPSSQVDKIMDNLRWKGFEVCTESHRGVHYYAHNTIFSFVVAGVFVAFVTFMLLTGLFYQAESCPGCPPDDHVGAEMISGVGRK